MSDDLAAELRRQAEAWAEAASMRTPGRWRLKPGNSTRVEDGTPDNTVVVSTHTSSFAPPREEAVRNAAFIVHAANADVATLLRAAADRLDAAAGAEAERDRLRDVLSRLFSNAEAGMTAADANDSTAFGAALEAYRVACREARALLPQGGAT